MECDGVCTDTTSDVAHCGACGHACGAAHGAPSCHDGKCEIACDAGFGDCNGAASDGCETDLTSDPGSCTACGVVCPSGACAGLHCAPELVLDGEGHEIAALLVDGGELIWADATAGYIYSSPVGWASWGQPNPIGGSPDVRGVALDAKYVYWHDATNLVAALRVGSHPWSTLTTGAMAFKGALGVDAESVYWIDAAMGKLMKTSIEHGGQTPIADAMAYSSGIESDGTSVFFTSHSASGVWSVARASIDGSAVTTIASGVGGSGTGIALDATHVYWVELVTSPAPHTVVRRAPRAGGAASDVWSGTLDGPYHLLVRGPDVYVLGFQTLIAVPASGGASRRVGTCSHLISGNAALAADGESIYCRNQDVGVGGIVRYPR